MAPIATLRKQINRTADGLFESPGGAIRLLPMEGLRGLAVLGVFFVHAHVLFGPYVAGYPRLFAISKYLGRFGNVGVDLFFVLSGFLIYGALIHKRLSYLRFIRRRVKRIYPTFLAVLIVYLALSVAFTSESRLPTHTPAAIVYILENLFFLPGLFHITPIITVAWSLSFEFAFYLLVPLFVLLLRYGTDSRVRRVALLGAMWVAFSALEAFAFHGAHIRMLSFLSGMLLHEFAASGWVGSFLCSTGEWGSLIALVLFGSYHFAIRPSEPGGVVSVALMSAALFFFVLYTLGYSGALHRACTWRPMRYWGNISYSYYLVHGLILKGVATLFTHSSSSHQHPLVIYFSALGFGLVATWVGAAILYLLVERPLSLTPAKQRLKIQPAAGLTGFAWMRRGQHTTEASSNQ